jgi:hypothetical protein
MSSQAGIQIVTGARTIPEAALAHTLAWPGHSRCCSANWSSEERVYREWIAWKAGRELRRVLRDEAQSAINRIGMPADVRAPSALGYSQAQLTQDILTASESAVSQVVSVRWTSASGRARQPATTDKDSAR